MSTRMAVSKSGRCGLGEGCAGVGLVVPWPMMPVRTHNEHSRNACPTKVVHDRLSVLRRHRVGMFG